MSAGKAKLETDDLAENDLDLDSAWAVGFNNMKSRDAS
jgi:hypothetical protein